MKVDTNKFLKRKNIEAVINTTPKIKIYFICGIVTGVVLIILGNIEIDYKQFKDIIPLSLKSVLISFGQALVVGLTIAMILDIPSLKKYFRNNVIDVLTSHDYLKTLKAEDIKELKDSCIQSLYTAKTEHYNPDLLTLNEKISELIINPYYDIYRVKSKKEKKENYFVKKTSLSFKVINPTKGNATEKIKKMVYLKRVEDVNCDDLYKISKFNVKVDNGDFIDYISKCKVTVSEIQNKNDSNDYISTLKTAEDEDICIEYKDELLIEIEDERILPNNDVIFVKRFSEKPIRSFIVDYSIDTGDYYLDGSCFGAFSDGTDTIRVVQQKHSIQIESYGWLLPGEGFFILRIKN